MIPMHMIEELAELAGIDDPEVVRLVETAALFPARSEAVYRVLKSKVLMRGVNLGKRPVFGAPSVLPAEGGRIGDGMIGDSPQGAVGFTKENLPGNVGIMGGSGSGKSCFAGLICEYCMRIMMSVLFLDFADEYGWLTHVFGPDRLLVIRARFFPLGLFVNPIGSRLDPVSWLSKITDVLGYAMYLKDGSINLLNEVVGTMYRERGVLDGSGDYPVATDVFGKLVTLKYSAGSRHSGFLETLVNRVFRILQSFPGMNAKGSLIPEQVTGKSLIIRMSDLSAYELDVFTNVFLAWLLCFKEGGK